MPYNFFVETIWHCKLVVIFLTVLRKKKLNKNRRNLFFKGIFHIKELAEANN